MQNIYLVFSFGVCFLILSSASGEIRQVCFPMDTIGATIQSSTPTQNCPGNSVGPPGPKGDPGVPGAPANCSCNPNEIEQLREAISLRDERIDRLFHILWQINPSRRVSFCGVGMKDGRVGNDQISASSNSNRYLPKYARLDRIGTNTALGGWSGRSATAGEWIQVDLLTPTRIVGVVTQGLNYPGPAEQWTKTYKISYGNVTNSMQVITNSDGEEIIFTGNTDNNSHVTNNFPTAITARYFRLIVQTWNIWGVVRLEYLVC